MTHPDQREFMVGDEVVVAQRGDEAAWSGRVVRGCCSEHVYVERPTRSTEWRHVNVGRLTHVRADARAASMDALDEALFACKDAGWTAADVVAHIAGHDISEDD